MQMSKPKTKLVVLVSHPIQYFAPVYRALAQCADLDFSVLFSTRVGVDSSFDAGFGRVVQWDIPLLDGYESHFLSQKTHLGGIEWPVIRYLLKARPDVLLLHGYSHPTNLLALLIAKLIGTRILMRGDTRPSPHHGKSFWKTHFKRLLFRFIDGCVAIGSPNRKYYELLGMPSDRIYFAPFCIDNAAFDLGDSRSEIRMEQRRLLEIEQSAKVVLFVAKLVAQKRLKDLLQAMEMLMVRYPEAVLLIVGSGTEESDLRESVARTGINARFLGFKNQTELPGLYAASDLFVLPAESESWGLVVNEAMASGLPIIISDDVGAATDLVEGKDTGLVYPVGDVERLSEALESLLKSAETLERMGCNAKKLIAEWSISASAEGIARAAQSIDGRVARW